MTQNLQNCCRICLDVESERVPILGNGNIHLHMKSCLGMSVPLDDELPKEICSSCVDRLSEFYNFQLNARCSLDWLESSLQEKQKKTTETKTLIQPLPDSEYNSDSLLEFLNNTANIEEYLNNLGKEDIPSIVNMLDRNQENSMDSIIKVTNSMKPNKQPSPKKKESMNKPTKIKIDVLDSEVDIVKKILKKEAEPKKSRTEKNPGICFACKAKFDDLQKLSQHFSTCDVALRTCIHCNMLFDSKLKMQEHSLIHSTLSCNCGKDFPSKELLIRHHKVCHIDYGASLGCIYRCKQCNETFKERFQLYKHAKGHVLKADEKMCDICGHKFVGNDALAKHRKEDHQLIDELLYRCKICRQTSADHQEMYIHVQTHIDKPEPERHLCETCGRCFITRSSLMRHVALHGNGHKCNICSKNFIDVRKRDEHVLQHIETVMCERCGQSVSCYKLGGHKCA